MLLITEKDAFERALALVTQANRLYQDAYTQKELETVRDHLNLKECHLLGQSWGGMLALEYLCNYPHEGIRSVILSSTLPSGMLWGAEQARMIRELPEDMQEAIRRRLPYIRSLIFQLMVITTITTNWVCLVW